jgi:CubicO group peptidase (beta-lactamase class C family)
MRDILEEGRAQGIFPAASLWVADGLEPLLDVHVGGAQPDSVWDVASLTKPMAVASMAMEMLSRGDLELSDQVGPSGVTIKELLGHRSGLPAWWDLPKRLDEELPGWTVGAPATRAAVKAAIERARDPAQAGALYSDLGYILLGWHLEAIAQKNLDELVPGYLAKGVPKDRVMSGGVCTYRARELWGEVNDVNTYILGGVAGHAGIFSRADEVGDWALELLRCHEGHPGRYEQAVVRSFWGRSHFDDSDTWVLGFDTPTPGKSSAGSLIGRNAVGHLGFTGTSVWIDPGPGRVVVLLTNRVAASPGAELAIKRFRPRLHDRLFAILNG